MNIQDILKTSGLNIDQDIILIGNGPSVLTSTTLANAEKSKLIARCNDYVTSGFEDKVGIRTDIWCVGDHVYEELSKKKKPPQLFTLVTHPKETRNGRPYKYSDNVFSVYVDDFDEVKNTFSKFKGICAHPSTGLLATMALSAIFKDVYIAGFDFFESKSHYYSSENNTQNQPPIGACHISDTEKKMILSKAKHLDIEYRNGNEIQQHKTGEVFYKNAFGGNQATSNIIKVAHIKKTAIANAPDYLSNVFNKFSNIIRSRVIHDISELEKDEIVHFHNRYSKCQNKHQFIQYHSEPVHIAKDGRTFYNPNITHYNDYTHFHPDFPIPLVISQYHCTLPEYAECLVVRNIFDFTIEEFSPFKSTKHVIAYSPSTSIQINRWSDKGYAETLPILMWIQENCNAEVDIIKNVPWKECIERKRRASIVIDECKTGSFHLSGLEGLALGKVTFCFLNEEVENALKKYTGSDTVPFENCHHTKLKDRLQEMLRLDPSEIYQRGLKNREWMERYWHPALITREFEQLYLRHICNWSAEKRMCQLKIIRKKQPWFCAPLHP